MKPAPWRECDNERCDKLWCEIHGVHMIDCECLAAFGWKISPEDSLTIEIDERTFG